MGKITFFSANDLNSIIVRKALQSRKLPYTEISLLDYPTKLSQLVALTGSLGLPKVFINTRSVGSGVDPILQELRGSWDFSNKHKTPAEKFTQEIECLSDPTNPVFTTTMNDPFQVDESNSETIDIQEIKIKLVDGSELEYLPYKDLVDYLKYTLPMKDEIQIKRKHYSKVFSGSDILPVIMKKLKCSTEEATVICTRLVQASVFHLVVSKYPSTSKDFLNSDEVYYRLQCYMSPDILNTYCPTKSISNSNIDKPISIVQYLFRLLREIQADCVDEVGMLDYSKCAIHSLLPRFEETICELQVINTADFSEHEKIAFGINIYKLMLSYAFIKIGIPLTEKDRLHFLTHVKFIISGNVFSFSDWIDGVLRSNQKGGLEKKIPFGKTDRRLSLVVKRLDPRIHFALNIGSLVGSGISTPFNVYSSKRIEYELDLSLQIFLEDRNNIDVDSKAGLVYLSRAVAMYMTDFSDDEEAFLNYLQDCTSATLKIKLQPKNCHKKMKVVSKHVNWGRFGKNFQRYEKSLVQGDLEGFKGLIQRFIPPRDATNEGQRLETLRRLKVLDTTPEERFDCITREVQVALAVPFVFISLVDTHRQWIKSTQCPIEFPKITETPRSTSFCGHAILQDNILVIEDALLDDRFADNPAVAGDFKVRFYAGVPLRIPGLDGHSHNVGTLCVVDHRPRQLFESEIRMLEDFASKAQNELLRNETKCTCENSKRYFI